MVSVKSVLVAPVLKAVLVSLPESEWARCESDPRMQTPFWARHPPVTLMPPAKVEVLAVDVAVM